MKRILFALAMVLAFSLTAQGKYRTVTENDSLGNLKRIIELHDTILNRQAVTDTLSITTYENSNTDNRHYDYDEDEDEANSDVAQMLINKSVLVPIVAIVFVFGLPVLLVFIIFVFRYKNRKAKYHLAEQALAAGQPLPESFFQELGSTYNNTRSKGIRNISVGIGLFIFLWAITESFAIGCIGLLIMFTGIGQVVIYYMQEKKDTSSADNQRTNAQ